MSCQPRLPLVLILALCLVVSAGAWGQRAPRISEPSYLDHQYMTQQRNLMDDIVRLNFGRQFIRLKRNDLELLQLVLDRGLVSPEQTRELQAMGVILGDVLAQELGLHWVIYEDELGRSRALQYQDTETVLFPITMISRRVEVGNRTPVADIYQKAYDIIDDLRPPQPYDVKPPGRYN